MANFGWAYVDCTDVGGGGGEGGATSEFDVAT